MAKQRDVEIPCKTSCKSPCNSRVKNCVQPTPTTQSCVKHHFPTHFFAPLPHVIPQPPHPRIPTNFSTIPQPLQLQLLNNI